MVNQSDRVVEMIQKLMKFNKGLRQDMAFSILIGSVIKPLVLARTSDADESLLNFVMTDIFAKSLDVLAPDAPHLLEMTQQIQCSLNLFIVLKGRFGSKAIVQEFSKTAEEKYFGNIRKTIESATDTNNKDLEAALALSDEDHMKAGKIADAKLKAEQLEVTKDLM